MSKTFQLPRSSNSQQVLEAAAENSALSAVAAKLATLGLTDQSITTISIAVPVFCTLEAKLQDRLEDGESEASIKQEELDQLVDEEIEKKLSEEEDGFADKDAIGKVLHAMFKSQFQEENASANIRDLIHAMHEQTEANHVQEANPE